jgi:ComF family protein
MLKAQEIKDSILRLIFPHVCDGCGSDLLTTESKLCLRCLNSLPETQFEFHENNPVEKMFWGRMNLQAASARFYFTKESLMQKLMHQFKYRENKDLGKQLGKLMGISLKNSGRFHTADVLVPLPLFANKEKKRGYNQAMILCEGIAEIFPLPILKDAVIRPQHTDTQTKKGRIERWKNIEGKFELVKPGLVRDKHILLVDDVITTGATLEACGTCILAAENTRLSLATLCQASH